MIKIESNFTGCLGCQKPRQKALKYKNWSKFKAVIGKAVKACLNSEKPISAHFSHVGKLGKTGLGVVRHNRFTGIGRMVFIGFGG